MSSTLHRKSIRRPVAVTVYKKSVAVLYLETNTTFDGVDHILRISFSSDCINFKLRSIPVTIENKSGAAFDLSHTKSFKLSKVKENYILTFIKENNSVIEAFSKDLLHFKIVKKHRNRHSIIITELQNEKKKSFYINYFGDNSISTQTSTNLKEWNHTKAIVISPRKGFFDNKPLEVLGVHPILQGIFVTYSSGQYITAFLASPGHPHRIIWRAENAVYECPPDRFPVGSVIFEDDLFIYVGDLDGNIYSASLPYSLNYLKKGKLEFRSPLVRSEINPVLRPTDNHWENEAVFNPAAIHDNKEFHLIYRAIGSNGISSFGYANSKNGFNFKRGSPEPIFHPLDDIKRITKRKKIIRKYNPSMYTSGGGWGGAEDPRAVKIDDKIYVTYMVFGGWDFMRMALTSISVDDFRNKEWNWTKPVIISPPGEVHKNWVLFPEKINGKYAVLHGIVPNILIEYVDDLDNIDGYISSPRPQGVQPGRKNFWDNRIRGAGPPPVKTKHGWLLIYHGIDENDPNRYKMGAMLLDLNDPTKILHRSPMPILAPDMHYENDGKPGVVYASGAIVHDGLLYVYYGGADKVVCVATVELDKFLKDLMAQ